MNADVNPVEPRRSEWATIVVLALAVLVAIVLLWPAFRNDEAGALADLPTVERRAAFERAMADVYALCLPEPKYGLRGHCREQAQFARDFPECDLACQTAVQGVLTPAPRPR